MKLTHRSTIIASFIGYITQAITINFAPLLFVTFGNQFQLSYSKISSLIAVTFCIQLFTDAITSRFPSLFRPRQTVVLAQLFACIGIAGFGLFPKFLPPYPALLLAVILSGAGSGLVEVMVTPIVESCPTDRKSAFMCLLHSFYCWGQMLVTLLSTFYFSLVGIGNWEYLAYLWACIPLLDLVLFCFVPIYPIGSEEGANDTRSYMKNKVFWLIFVMMICSGAAEQAMSQWASTFAETGLGVDKALGDLLGPCLFAALMGCSRVLYAKVGDRISLNRFMALSGGLCIVSYLLAALSGNPILSLVGCALCGLSVGVMWPGNISNASALLPGSGISMFAFLALAGDIGCLAGPSLVGTVAERFGNNIRVSFLLSLIFPVGLLIALALSVHYAKKEKQKNGNTNHPYTN